MSGLRGVGLGVAMVLSAGVWAGCSVTGDGVKKDNEGAGGGDASTSSSAGTGGDTSTTSTTGSGMNEEPSCDNPPAGLDPSSLPLCSADMCSGGARCIPTSIVESTGGPEQAEQLANCDADNKCVPDLFIETGGFFTAPTCTSLLGAEGRCLSTCIPEVAEQDERVKLPVDICPEHTVCAPCYDPQTGESSGACEQSCDRGPVDEPVLLPACCSERGKCVPKTAVPDAQISNLGDYGCTDMAGGDFICAPNVFIDDLSYSPPVCNDLPFIVEFALPAGYKDARCLPNCLPALDDSPAALQQGACPADHLCAPCYKPALLGDPEPTGACDL